jgi:PBSX family phage terminase large subunit
MMFEWDELSPKQREYIFQSDARINIAEGSVRSGKTISSIVAWIKFILEAPPGELLMVGKTERTLKRNVLNVLADMVGNKYFSLNRGEGEATLFGRRIYIAGASDERAEGKIRGLTLAGAYGDEITLWPESFFTVLLSRLSVPGARFFGTTNPDSPYHWLKKGYLDRGDSLNMKCWHFTLDDNFSLDPFYVESLRQEYQGVWFKRYILGLWVLAEGIIYDMWDGDKHICRFPEGLTNFIVAVDYGTSNPCTFGLYGWTGGFPVYLMKEYWHDSRGSGRQKTDSEYADDFVSWLEDIRPSVVYVDPSAASFIVELRKRGFRVRGADNSVGDGLRFVASLLTRGGFLVDPSCTNTIAEFSSYVWDSKAQLKGEDKPLKQNDHAMDRNRYALFSHFGRAGRGPVDKPPGW